MSGSRYPIKNKELEPKPKLVPLILGSYLEPRWSIQGKVQFLPETDSLKFLRRPFYLLGLKV